MLGFLSALQGQPCVTIVDDDDLFRITLGDVLQERGLATASIDVPHDVADQLEGDGEVLVLDMRPTVSTVWMCSGGSGTGTPTCR